jgi:hypothetical protein
MVPSHGGYGYLARLKFCGVFIKSFPVLLVAVMFGSKEFRQMQDHWLDQRAASA